MPDGITPRDIWREVLRVVSRKVGAKERDTWLRPLVCRANADGLLVLEAPNVLYRDFVLEHYAKVLEEAAKEVCGHAAKVEIEAAAGQEGLFAGSGTRAAARPASPTAPPTRLNALYTFDTFVVGRSNVFCHAACRAVAQNPGSKYNPLFIYGGVGLGKTHLMHAIGHEVLRNSNGMRLTYLSCDQFMNEMIAAVKNNRTDAFRRKYRSVDFLLVDDVQFLAGMEGTQVEFFHTFNELYEAGRQIVLSSDRPPKDIPKLEERLSTRFEWGLIADIQPPDYELRRAIISKKAELKNLTLPEDVVDLIATRITTNIRAIEGVLNRLAAVCLYQNAEVTTSLAQEMIREVAPEERRASYTMEQLMEATARYFNLRGRDLISKSRRANIARARQFAMFLCREKTNASLADIGAAFGNRDHTTVLYSISKIEADAKAGDEKTLKILNDLYANLGRMGVQ